MKCSVWIIQSQIDKIKKCQVIDYEKKKIICDTLIYISHQYFHRIKFTFLEIKYYSRSYQNINPDFLTNILTLECPRFSTRYPKVYLPSHTAYTEILSYC